VLGVHPSKKSLGSARFVPHQDRQLADRGATAVTLGHAKSDVKRKSWTPAADSLKKREVGAVWRLSFLAPAAYLPGKSKAGILPLWMPRSE
jgi:hypothetical protein